MNLNKSHPLNRKAIDHFSKKDAPAIASPDSHPDPYWSLGSHPEAVERVWDHLGGALPVNCRVILFGTPALVDPKSGIILATAYGCAYALRVPEEQLDAAYKTGCRAIETWSSGEETKIENIMGRGWVFGAWKKKELQWILEVYNQLQIT
jgi:hypothetical protein